MSRPRWHDVLIVTAIVALFVVGVWALWADDVRAVLHLASADGSGSSSAPSIATGST